MSLYVVDASVTLKWLLPQKPEKPDVEQAIQLFEAAQKGEVQLLQPPHWLAEIAGVLVRLVPVKAEDYLADLYAWKIPIENSFEIYALALELAREFNHHVFDTLYHAVALVTPGAFLITADDRYHRKAEGRGALQTLADLSLPGT